MFTVKLRYVNIVVAQEVPDYQKFFVTRWSRDAWAQMSYSFVKTGGSGEAYDIIAEDVQGKVFFAGEVRLLKGSPSYLQPLQVERVKPLYWSPQLAIRGKKIVWQ